MKKDDYITEFEEQRKKINLDGETEGDKKLSRVELHSKKRKPKKRSRYSLINILLVLFALIPIGILVYVIVSWNLPNNNIASKLEESQFQFEKSKKTDGNSEKIVNKEKEQEDNKKDEKTSEQIEAEEKEKAEVEAKAKAEAEAKAKEEEKRKEEAARQQAEQEKQQAEKNESDTEHKSQARTHIVAPGETLYRISVNYYKSGDGVNKIMQANGLTTNDISVGQTLIIP